MGDVCQYVYARPSPDGPPSICGAIESIHGTGLGLIGEHPFTPAPTARLTEASEALLRAHPEWHSRGCRFIRMLGREDDGSLARCDCVSRDRLAAIEREAIARHREQADAEVARLREALEEAVYGMHWWAVTAERGAGVALASRLHIDNASRWWDCYPCQTRAALATRPPTPSPEQGA